MPRATSSPRVMPPKMLKRMPRTSASEVMTSSRGRLLRVTAAAQVAEVRGAPANLVDDVERGHNEAGAVSEDADVAVPASRT